MKYINITEIEVTPEVAAALCPDGEHSPECYAHGLIACCRCPMDTPKDGDLILLRVVSAKPKGKQSEVITGS